MHTTIALTFFLQSKYPQLQDVALRACARLAPEQTAAIMLKTVYFDAEFPYLIQHTTRRGVHYTL